MVEELALIALGQRFPVFAGRLKQGEGAHDVGAGEGERVFYRSVDMAFGGEVDNAVDPVLADYAAHGVEIGDVGAHESVIRAVFDIAEVSEIPCIGQLVEVDDMIVGIFVDEEADDVVADESGPSGDKYVTLHCLSVCSGIRRASRSSRGQRGRMSF